MSHTHVDMPDKGDFRYRVVVNNEIAYRALHLVCVNDILTAAGLEPICPCQNWSVRNDPRAGATIVVTRFDLNRPGVSHEPPRAILEMLSQEPAPKGGAQ